MAKNLPVPEFAEPSFAGTLFSAITFRDQRSDAIIDLNAPLCDGDWPMIAVLGRGTKIPPARTTLSGEPDFRFKDVGGFRQRRMEILDFAKSLQKLRSVAGENGKHIVKRGFCYAIDMLSLHNRSKGVYWYEWAEGPIYFDDDFHVFLDGVALVENLVVTLARHQP